MFRPILSRLSALTFVLGMAPPAAAQQSDAEIQVVPVAAGVHMLAGQGGNIGVSSGPDGVFLIDDQYAPLTDEIVAAVRTISEAPIRFVLNTHWHGDHTGGNENLGAAGALIVAHDNVRERMSVEQFLERYDRRVPPAPEGALPVVTFSETVTFYLNGDTLHALHVPHAHTDGDAIIHFRAANAIHMGDTYFAGRYPFIDLGSGGSVDGLIAAVERALALCDADTRVIPGHGVLTGPDELRAYLEVLRTTRDRVQAAIADGRSLEEMQAAGLTAEWDAAWGGGFIGPDDFIASVYRSLTDAR